MFLLIPNQVLPWKEMPYLNPKLSLNPEELPMESKWSLEDDTNAFALQISCRQEQIMLDIDISSRGLEQLLVFVTSEDGRNAELQLSFRKSTQNN